MQFGQPVARDVRLLSDGVGFATISYHLLLPKDQYFTTNVPLSAFQKKSLSVWFPLPPKKSRWGGCCKKKKKRGGGEAEAILNTGKCILGICLESQKDTLIILANYIPVRGEYIYIFNIQLIYKNFFDQIDMPFILKSCAKISSLDSLMCEVMNLFSSLLQNAFHFSLQMKTPTLLTSGLPLLNTIFKYKRNHTRTVPLGFCLTFLYIWEGKLMALCLQT